MDPVVLGDRATPVSSVAPGRHRRAKSRQRSPSGRDAPTGTTPTDTSDGLLSVKKSRRRNKHTSDSVQGSLNLSLDDLEELPEIPPLVYYSPWKYIGVTSLIFAICVVSDALTAMGIPMADMTGGDLFITAGWFAEFIAVVFVLIAMLLLYFQKHPYSRSILLFYFISLLCFCVNSLLHSSRINTFEFGFFKDYRNVGMQLKWLGCLFFYVLFCFLVYQAPRERVHKPTDEEVQKHTIFADIRRVQNANRRLARATLEEVKQRKKLEQEKLVRPPSVYESDEEDEGQHARLGMALRDKDGLNSLSGRRSASRSPPKTAELYPDAQNLAQVNIGAMGPEDGLRSHSGLTSIRRKDL